MMDREQYIAALKAHDWSHEWSDDHRRWREGREERELLRMVQSTLDPDFALWNQHAPKDFRVGVPA